MKIIQAEVYTFDELSEKAKDNAIHEYQATYAAEDFDFDMQMIINNLVQDLEEIGVNVNKKDIIWDTYNPYFAIKASRRDFDDEIDPIIQQFMETNPEIFDIEFPQVDMFTTFRGETKLDRHLFEIIPWRSDTYCNSAESITKTTTLVNQLLDAIEPKFTKMMELLNQAKIEMEEDEKWRFSEERAIELFSEDNIYFNVYGRIVNVEVLQPTPEVSIQ